MSAAFYPQVQKIYVAYYGRPADPAGLQYWAGQLAANGGNLTSIINAFGNSSESTALYAGASDSAKVTAIYQQLFNRAPDSAGLAFYTGELTAGRMTAASIALNVANGASGTDLTSLNNKVTVGTAFTDALTVDSAAAVAYTGTTAITAARSLITGVTTSAATTNVASTITSIKSGGGATAGQTFTLTTGGTDVVAGTAANDTINAAAGTFQATDVISDASTSDADVMNLTMNSYSSTQTLISGVETINISGVYTSAGLDAQNVVNTKTVNLSAGITGGTGTVVNASAQKITAVNAGSNIATLNVNADAFTGGTGGTIAVGAGSASTITIGNNGNTGTDSYTVSPGVGSTLRLRGGSDGTDTFTVTLAGGATTLNVDNQTAGTGDIDNLNLVSGGSAANTVTLAVSDETLVDSGTGDKLVISGTQNLTFAGSLDPLADIGGTGSRLTNVALEKAAGYTGTVTFNSNAALAGEGFLNRATGLDVINVTQTALGANLTINENTTLNLAINNESRLYNVDNATTTAATAGSMTLKIGLTGDSATNATQTGISAGANVGTLVITNNTINSTITTLTTTTATTADTIVVNGNKNLTIGTWNATANEVLTAANMTGNLTATSANAAATIIGGSGSDILTGSTLSDSLVGGAGDDVLSGGAGQTADTMVGGAGSDRFIMIASTADTISDFSVSGTNGTDVIAISIGADTVSTIAGANAVVAAGATAQIRQISSATTLAAADNIFVLTGTFANQTAMEAAIESGGTRQITFGGAPTTSDDIVLVWSDGSNSYVGYYNLTTTALIPVAADAFTNVLTLTGLTSVDSLTASNFLFIA